MTAEPCRDCGTTGGRYGNNANRPARVRGRCLRCHAKFFWQTRPAADRPENHEPAPLPHDNRLLRPQVVRDRTAALRRDLGFDRPEPVQTRQARFAAAAAAERARARQRHTAG